VIDYPPDAIIMCLFGYEELEGGALENKTADSLILAVKPSMSFTYDTETHLINKFPIESGGELVHNSIKLTRGIENEMTHMVNQLIQRFIFSNGDVLDQFSYYYPGQNYVNAKNPNVAAENSEWVFNGKIEFQF